jgi:hypothetical protein
LVADIEVDVEAVSTLGVDEARQRTHRFQKHRRAAWTAVPIPSGSLLSGHKGILVEISVPGKRDPAQNSVVEDAFQFIRVLGIGKLQVHLMVEERCPH